MVGAAVVFVVTVGLVDLLTHPNLAYSSFYVLPVLIASWRGPRAAGMTLATIGAVIWTIAHSPYLPRSTPELLPAWNLVMRLSTLALVAWLVGELRTQLARAERQSRTDNLTGLATRGWFLETLLREVERGGDEPSRRAHVRRQADGQGRVPPPRHWMSRGSARISSMSLAYPRGRWRGRDGGRRLPA